MSQEERFGTRDRTYSAWHRRASLGRVIGADRTGAGSRPAVQIWHCASASCKARSPPGLRVHVSHRRPEEPGRCCVPGCGRVPSAAHLPAAGGWLARADACRVGIRFAPHSRVVGEAHRPRGGERSEILNTPGLARRGENRESLARLAWRSNKGEREGTLSCEHKQKSVVTGAESGDPGNRSQLPASSAGSWGGGPRPDRVEINSREKDSYSSLSTAFRSSAARSSTKNGSRSTGTATATKELSIGSWLNARSANEASSTDSTPCTSSLSAIAAPLRDKRVTEFPG